MLKIFRSNLAAGRKRSASVGGFAKREDGAAALEFAIVAAPFIALLLATVQTAGAFFAGQVLESAVTDASRLVLTGTAKATMDQTAFATAVCGKVQALFNCSGLMIDVQTATSFATANTAMPSVTHNGSGNVTNTWQYNPGNPGDIVVMRVMYEWPVFLGPLGLSLSNESNGRLLLMATATFRNEP